MSEAAASELQAVRAWTGVELHDKEDHRAKKPITDRPRPGLSHTQMKMKPWKCELSDQAAKELLSAAADFEVDHEELLSIYVLQGAACGVVHPEVLAWLPGQSGPVRTRTSA